MSQTVEIRCPACNRDTLLMRTPRYEGFTRAGETLSCSACGHEFENEESVPFRHRRAVRVFTDADRPASVRVFDEREAEKLCRHCAHYVVNPFMQWCGRHKREVEATDSCRDFERRPDPEPKKEDDPPAVLR